MLLTFFKGFFREIKRLCRDKRSLLLYVAAPIFMGVLICGAFSNGVVNRIPIAVVDMQPSAKTRELIRAFEQAERMDITAVMQDAEAAKQMLEAGEVEGLLVIPTDYTRNLQLGQQAEVLVGFNSTNLILSNSGVSSVQQIVKTISAQIAVKSYVASGSTTAEGTAKAMPISTVMRPWFNSHLSYLIYLAPGLVGILFHQLFLITVASSVVEEKKDGILSGRGLKRENSIYLLDKMLFYGITGFFLLLVNYAVMIHIFDYPVRGDKNDMLLLSSAFIFALTGFGILLGLFCKQAVHVTQWVISLTYPFFILSGISWPHSEMPQSLVQIAQIFPLTHFLTPFREMLLMNVGFEQERIRYHGQMLLLFGGVTILLSIFLFIGKQYRMEKKQVQGEVAEQ